VLNRRGKKTKDWLKRFGRRKMRTHLPVKERNPKTNRSDAIEGVSDSAQRKAWMKKKEKGSGPPNYAELQDYNKGKCTGLKRRRLKVFQRRKRLRRRGGIQVHKENVANLIRARGQISRELYTRGRKQRGGKRFSGGIDDEEEKLKVTET